MVVVEEAAPRAVVVEVERPEAEELERAPEVCPVAERELALAEPEHPDRPVPVEREPQAEQPEPVTRAPLAEQPEPQAHQTVEREQPQAEQPEPGVTQVPPAERPVPQARQTVEQALRQAPEQQAPEQQPPPAQVLALPPAQPRPTDPTTRKTPRPKPR